MQKRVSMLLLINENLTGKINNFNKGFELITEIKKKKIFSNDVGYPFDKKNRLSFYYMAAANLMLFGL